MNKAYWALLTIEQEITPAGYIIVCTTDVPCHLFMRWTLITPKQHKIPVLRRGIFMHTDKYFCFDVYTDNQQEEAGDTYIHTFIKEPWAVCETRYFYFHGTIASIASPSTSAIFKKHRPTPPPPTAFFIAANHDNLTHPANRTWTPILWGDGSPLSDHLPANTIGLFIHSRSGFGTNEFGLRPKGSTHNIIWDVAGDMHQWVFVPVNENIEAEIYIQSYTSQPSFLEGYVIEGGAVFFTDPTEKTPPDHDAWVTIDLSDICPNAIGILAEIVPEASGFSSGIRKTGSTDNRTQPMFHTWAVIGCDENQKIDFYAFDYLGIKQRLFIWGYIIANSTFNTNAPDKTPPRDWQYHTVNIPKPADLGFFEFTAPWTGEDYALRAMEATHDLPVPPNYRHNFCTVPINANGDFEAKLATDFDGMKLYHLGEGH